MGFDCLSFSYMFQLIGYIVQKLVCPMQGLAEMLYRFDASISLCRIDLKCNDFFLFLRVVYSCSVSDDICRKLLHSWCANCTLNEISNALLDRSWRWSSKGHSGQFACKDAISRLCCNQPNTPTWCLPRSFQVE